MNNLHDLVPHLKESTEDLYKIHSGHRVFDDHSDRSNSSSDENSEIDIRDAQFRPPLYSYGDLITNLVEYYGTESNVECKLKALANGTGPEQIAHNLAEQITEDHCFICNASGTKHYRQAVHFKAVRSWIQKDLADLKDPVDWTLLFCQVCNLPLSGNETALAHYYEPSHVENTSSFCTTCLRVIDAHNMANHCKTLKHEKNADSLNLPPVVECQKEDNLQRENGTGLEQIAHKLAEQITEDHCFICNASGTKHYRQAVHFKAVRSWIQNALADLKDPVDWTLLFCQVCNLPLSGNETALAHYYEPSHVENTSSFCTTCLRVIDAHNMANHCKTLKHEKNADSLNLPPVVECQKDDNLQRENGTGLEQIAHKLAEQITEDHCFICNASGTKHYRQAVHFKAVRSWIQKALADLKDPVDWTLLFCQVCNLPLSGNETALAHYYEPSHVENTSSFCTTCLRVIDAHNMANHCKTLKHEKNADSLNLPPVVECQKDDNLQRENGTGPTKTGLEQIAHKLAEQITEDHCFMCNASGTKHYRQAVHFKTVRSSIQEVLADLKEPVDWTLLFCQVCNLSLSGTETALAHYLEPSHVENASSFCPICVRVIDACNMVPHCMSRNHKNKAALNFPSTIKCGKDIALQVGGKAKNAIKIETYVPETVESNDIVMSASDVVIEPSQSQQGPTGKEGGDWSFEGVSEANMKSIEVEKYASETVVSAKSSIIQTSQSQLEDSLSKEIVEASIKPIAGEKHVLEATDIDVLANSTIIEPSQSELEATSEEDDNSLSMGISRFEKNIAQVLDERKTAFSSIQFSYLIMCIRNFRRLLQLQLKEGKTFKIRTAFEWSPSNFPGRISFVFMVDDYDIFHLMLNHESAQLCSFVKDQQCLTTTRSFRKFNEYLLIGLEECAAIGGPFGLIGEDDTMDASSVFDDYGDYVDDTGDVQHITTFFEKLLVIKEIVKTMRGIIIRICAPPSHTTYVYNSCQISKLITYMKNFSDFVQKNRDAFYIEDVFKNNKKPSCQAFGLQDFERCKNVVYRELDDLVRFALREQELCCEAVVSYFSQFTWKLLVMLQMDNMINEAISKLSTERNELHRQMALFKLTTGRILCNRQTPWVLAETRKFIMLIRNFQESIKNCQVFTPNRFRKPLMIGALKMASDYDIYKLILYQEMDKLCSLVSSQQRIPYSDKVNYFQNFNRELVLAIEDFDKGDLGLSDSDDSEDDDSSFYSACVCSCPKFCVSNT